MLKIGHRGAKGHLLENTIPSFIKAVELGVDGIELDVHLSADGVVVVLHDTSIDRTTAQKGLVKDLSVAQLQALGIPTLQEVFDLLPSTVFVNIEIKAREATEEVVALIAQHRVLKGLPYGKFQISSFDWEVLKTAKTIDPKILLGVLTEEAIDEALVFAEQINAHSINPYYKLLTTENIARVHQKGFKIYTWTVNSPEDLTFVQNLNVDGIISDFPDRL